MYRDSLVAGKGSQKHLMATATWTMGMKTQSTRAETRQTQRHSWLLVPTALHISQKYRYLLVLYRTVIEDLTYNLLVRLLDNHGPNPYPDLQEYPKIQLGRFLNNGHCYKTNASFSGRTC